MIFYLKGHGKLTIITILSLFSLDFILMLCRKACMHEDEKKQATIAPSPLDYTKLRDALGQRSVVFVGLMGAGKSTIGKQFGLELGLDFFDADHEIEAAAQMNITDIFTLYGEEEFRQLERRVILRLLQTTARQRPIVLATGGGAFMNQETRALITAHAISIWLKAELDLLMERVLRKNTRPLLQNDDPRAVMRNLMTQRYPVYALADITVQSRDASREEVTADVMTALLHYLSLNNEG